MSTEIKKMDAQVEQYVERQISPQKKIVGRLRKIILRTFPDVKEEMKMGVPWYEGRLCCRAESRQSRILFEGAVTERKETRR